MILDDISALNRVIRLGRPNRSSKFKDTHDPEVDKLFNSSPPLADMAATFEFESILRMEKGEELGKEKRGDLVVNSGANSVGILSEFRTSSSSDYFSPIPVPLRSAGSKSTLSTLLESTSSSVPERKSNANKMILTIYLPDCNSIEIGVSETDNFDDVINRTLATHKEQGRRPELYYNCPEMYELRMHEGLAVH